MAFTISGSSSTTRMHSFISGFLPWAETMVADKSYERLDKNLKIFLRLRRRKRKAGKLPASFISQSSRAFCMVSITLSSFASRFSMVSSAFASCKASSTNLRKALNWLSVIPMIERSFLKWDISLLYRKTTRRSRLPRPYFFSGMVKINRVDSASLSARRVPLCSLAMSPAMLRPRPKPLFSPREASAR